MIIESIIVKRRLFIVNIIFLLLNSLAHFIMPFVERPHFCFAGNFIVGFAIDKMKFKGTNVAVGFFGWFL